ncbi:MAG TPA: nucleotidyltransferase family protein [Bacteroidales bacterium]|nr:nucleotidyltransferase family protein [Bacteroidales bacterium]
MKAMIFAAGLGTRLGELTKKTPKALVDINGKSALRIAVEKLTAEGFDDIIVNIHHHPDSMLSEIHHLCDEGFRISVSDESAELLDTGGGLFNARHFFGSEPFLVYNVDIFSDINLKALYDAHLSSDAIATLAVRHRNGNRMLVVDKKGRLMGWCNNATKEEILTVENKKGLEQIAFTGIHVVSPAIFNLMQEGIYSMTSLYLMLAGSHKINTFLYDDGYWFDCGTPENLGKIRKQLSIIN